MKFKTTYAPRIVTTAAAPKQVLRTDADVAALIAKYKPVAAAHAKAKAATTASATETTRLLADVRAVTAKLRGQFAKKGD